MMLADMIVLTGGLTAVGIFLMLERDLLAVVFGVAILSNAANLFVLLSSGSPEGKSTPIVGESLSLMVDPLPQALILTAIVIGSGILAYLIFLVYRLYSEHQSSDLLEIDKGPARVPPPNIATKEETNS